MQSARAIADLVIAAALAALVPALVLAMLRLSENWFFAW